MLSKLKTLLGISDTTKDALLTLILEMCEQEAQNYTHNDDISSLTGAILSMAVYQYSRLDTAGLDSEDYSGVSLDYSSDYPPSIKRQLNAHRKAIFK